MFRTNTSRRLFSSSYSKVPTLRKSNFLFKRTFHASGENSRSCPIWKRMLCVNSPAIMLIAGVASMIAGVCIYDKWWYKYRRRYIYKPEQRRQAFLAHADQKEEKYQEEMEIYRKREFYPFINQSSESNEGESITYYSDRSWKFEFSDYSSFLNSLYSDFQKKGKKKGYRLYLGSRVDNLENGLTLRNSYLTYQNGLLIESMEELSYDQYLHNEKPIIKTRPISTDQDFSEIVNQYSKQSNIEGELTPYQMFQKLKAKKDWENYINQGLTPTEAVTKIEFQKYTEICREKNSFPDKVIKKDLLYRYDTLQIYCLACRDGKLFKHKYDFLSSNKNGRADWTKIYESDSEYNEISDSESFEKFYVDGSGDHEEYLNGNSVEELTENILNI